MSNEIYYEKSSGNIFKDLELPNSEERLAKAKLASKIVEIVKKKKLTQREAASLLGIDQPKISALFRGNLSRFSIMKLIKFLNLLEQNITINISENKNVNEHVGHINVAC